MDCTYVSTVDIIAAHLADLIEQAEAHVLQPQQVNLWLDKKQLIRLKKVHQGAGIVQLWKKT